MDVLLGYWYKSKKLPVGFWLYIEWMCSWDYKGFLTRGTPPCDDNDDGAGDDDDDDDDDDDHDDEIAWVFLE